jgi:hypothetical protein
MITRGPCPRDSMLSQPVDAPLSRTSDVETRGANATRRVYLTKHLPKLRYGQHLRRNLRGGAERW